MVEKLFVLSHVCDDDDNNAKMLGVFSSEDLARSAAARYAKLPGFINYPDGFDVSLYDLNREYWEEGFGID